MMDFKNKVILVSGSASGIGYSCSDLLLKQGANVTGFDLQANPIRHDKYQHYQIDILDEPRIKQTIDDIEKRYGKIDGLANCAGVYSVSKPFYEITLSEWNRVISTNLTGMFLLSKYVACKMIKRHEGSIVNISCIRSRIFRPKMADYAASKGGVVALTSAMALDLQQMGIRVNSVAPGFTYTGMTKTSFDNPEIRSFSESIIPAGRIADPEDIANVVLFLLSDLAGYVNGETIFVDGGFIIQK